MRALLIVIALARFAYADQAEGFDHRIHDRAVVTSGAASIACASCHAQKAGKLIGRPGHGACFGACHGAAPKAPAFGGKLGVDDTRVCVACHAKSALEAPYRGTLPVPYPPYAIDPDFTTSLGHKRHQAVACVQCHTDPGTKRVVIAGAPHRRCAGCHDGSGAADHGPAMTACEGCHVPGSGTPLPPKLQAVPLPVSPAFSHGKHAARSAAGKQCTTCHAALKETDDVVLPQPTVETCGAASCHDGKAAFATIEACTKCHAAPPVKTWEVERPKERFSHGNEHHKDLVQKTPCSQCHPLSAHGEAELAGHAQCVGCHAHQNEFTDRKPTICGACHNSTEPWRKLTTDRRPPERTDFGAMISHKLHAAPCESCHRLSTQAQQLRPPRGHASCTGKGCHRKGDGPAPKLEACTGCHQLELIAKRERERDASPWSVRRTFDHRTHAKDPTGAALACAACHTNLDGASFSLATPAKATCAPCHDGAIAFKLTGTTCTRCHPGKKTN
jgi:c(7)-type cytochrome triheme protein